MLRIGTSSFCQVRYDWGRCAPSLEEEILQASDGNAAPSSCPDNCLFVPSELGFKVLQFCHDSKLSVHPGVSCTFWIVKQRFWWPTVRADVKAYVAACPVCSCAKASDKAPAGLLHPLPVSRRPWSHVSMDFASGLPVSKGKTAVMTIIDRFLKMVHFIALPKLPSAQEMARLVIDHVFRLHGIPEDIVSGRGPQFIAKFWAEFCRIF